MDILTCVCPGANRYVQLLMITSVSWTFLTLAFYFVKLLWSSRKIYLYWCSFLPMYMIYQTKLSLFPLILHSENRAYWVFPYWELYKSVCYSFVIIHKLTKTHLICQCNFRQLKVDFRSKSKKYIFICTSKPQKNLWNNALVEYIDN